MQNQHEAGRLKQSNKQHKGGRGKRALKKLLGAGRTNQSEKSVSALKLRDYKHERKNQNKQRQKDQRSAIWLQRRIGSNCGPPKIIGIIPLTIDADSRSVLGRCLECADWSIANASDAVVQASFLQYKMRCSFIVADDYQDIMHILDIAKVSDTLLFVVGSDTSSQSLFDKHGETSISALKAIGLPDYICCIDDINTSTKKRLEAKKLMHRTLATLFSTNAIKSCDSNNGPQICRLLSSAGVYDITWRKIRSHMLAAEVEILPSQGQAVSDNVSIRVRGFLRGRPMMLDSLVHVAGVGTCRIGTVGVLTDPFPVSSVGDIREPSVINSFEADVSRQDSLLSESEPNILAGEQTWPSEEEISISQPIGDDIKFFKSKGNLRIPHGMSEYQADWLINENSDFESNDGHTASVKDIGEENFEEESVKCAEDSFPLKKFSPQDDIEFPDEVDTPSNVSARARFARYRTLQSFRGSPWNPKENLPQEYSRIFQFENFSSTQNSVLSEGKRASSVQDSGVLLAKSSSSVSASSNDGSMATDFDGEDISSSHEGIISLENGSSYIKSNHYLDIVLHNVSSVVIDVLRLRGYLTLFSLLEYENKTCVLNYNIQRSGQYDGDIKSKDPFVFVTGFRTLVARPIFSEANLNCDKHKMERFLHPGRFSVASVYGPITFLPCPTLLFRRSEADSNHFELVAFGNLGSIDPDRIILKKVVLTGLPVRAKKRFAVIKHMFYDPEDARYFKPAELTTKHGLRGHITESVGTHGLFKAVFNGPIMQNDTVMLTLYKRVFPKFYEEKEALAVLK